MTKVYKAKPVHPYATYIPGRSGKAFKTHATLGHAKLALDLYLNRFKYRGEDGHTRYQDDGTYTDDMTLFKLNLETLEYETWVEVSSGDKRSDHPELMPNKPNPHL